MNTLVEVKNLKKYFKSPAGNVHAVDDVSFKIPRGTTLGLVGESGCGKTTLGRLLIGLLPATDGEVLIEGENIVGQSAKLLRKKRHLMQIIFQDPHSSLNPRHTVAQSIMEPIICNKLIKGKNKIRQRTLELMETVGLASDLYDAYPHELDGGRKQRIGVARALSVNPKFIVCDEPVSALDVSIQAQILNLLMDLQEELGLTYFFITHDLSVVRHISDEIAVMYLGQCIEKAPAKLLFTNPLHPYTKALLAAIPHPDLERGRLPAEILKGEIVNPINPKPGCRFLPRCPNAKEGCEVFVNNLQDMGDNHYVSCRLFAEATEA